MCAALICRIKAKCLFFFFSSDTYTDGLNCALYFVLRCVSAYMYFLLCYMYIVRHKEPAHAIVWTEYVLRIFHSNNNVHVERKQTQSEKKTSINHTLKSQVSWRNKTINYSREKSNQIWKMATATAAQSTLFSVAYAHSSTFCFLHDSHCDLNNDNRCKQFIEFRVWFCLVSISITLFVHGN